VDSISVGRFDQNQAAQRLSLSLPGKNEMEFFSFFCKTFSTSFFLNVFLTPLAEKRLKMQ
jgi:hypothetical protein